MKSPNSDTMDYSKTRTLAVKRGRSQDAFVTLVAMSDGHYVT
jgi:hypothetical protein